MAKVKGFGVSPLSNKIYFGTQDTEKQMWTGDKTDVTDDAIAAVFEWFIGNMENKVAYKITYPDSEYELIMRKRNDD